MSSCTMHYSTVHQQQCKGSTEQISWRCTKGNPPAVHLVASCYYVRILRVPGSRKGVVQVARERGGARARAQIHDVRVGVVAHHDGLGGALARAGHCQVHRPLEIHLPAAATQPASAQLLCSATKKLVSRHGC